MCVCVVEQSFLHVRVLKIKWVSYLNEITTSSLLAFSLQFTLSKSTLVLFLNNVLSTYTFFLEVQTTLCHHDCFATRTTRLNVLSSAGKLKYKDFSFLLSRVELFSAGNLVCQGLFLPLWSWRGENINLSGIQKKKNVMDYLRTVGLHLNWRFIVGGGVLNQEVNKASSLCL